MTEPTIEQSRDRVDDWRRVWREDGAPLPTTGPFRRWLQRLLAPLVRAELASALQRQRDFNLTTLDLAQDLKTNQFHAEARLDAIQAGLRSDIARTGSELGGDIAGVASDLSRDLRQVQQDITRDVSNLGHDIEVLQQNVARDIGDAIARVKADFAGDTQKALDAIRRDFSGDIHKALNDIVVDFSREMEKRISVATADLTRDLRVTVEDLKVDFARDLSASITDVTADVQNSVVEIQADIQSAVSAAKSDFSADLAASIAALQADASRATAEVQSAMARDLSAAVSELGDAVRKDVAAVQGSLSSDVQSIQEAVVAAQEELARNASQLAADITRLQGAIIDMQAGIASVQKELVSDISSTRLQSRSDLEALQEQLVRHMTAIQTSIAADLSASNDDLQRDLSTATAQLASDIQTVHANARADTEAVQRELVADLAALQSALVDIQKHSEKGSASVRDLATELQNVRDAIIGNLTEVQNQLSNDVHTISETIRRIEQHQLPVAVRRNDALIAAVDQKVESVAVRLRDLSTPAVKKQRRPETFPSDFVYRRLEDALRGNEAGVAASLASYVELARDHQPVIDVGCGRGEFLALCDDAGIESSGYDVNELSVADARARGLDATVGAVPRCLTKVADHSIGSILASHVVEHLPSEVLLAFFTESARVLREGGLLMIETPNAESVGMSAVDFWRDPTHLAPRHVAALTVLARETGFTVERAEPAGEWPAALMFPMSGPPETRAMAARLNEIFYAPPNLRLILRKTVP